MPWYKVPMTVYLQAPGAGEAQDAALALVSSQDDPDGPLTSALYPAELSPAELAAHLELRKVLQCARADADAGELVSDPRRPGVKLSPAAAAQLAALEFESLQEE